jgi:hypothetical protein
VKRRRLASALTATVIVASLAACSRPAAAPARRHATTTTPAAQVRALVLDAAASTESTKSAHETMSGTLTIAQGGEEETLTITGSGVVRFSGPAATSYALTFALPSTNQAFTIREVVVGNAVYEQAAASAKWVEIADIAHLNTDGMTSALTVGGDSTSPPQLQRLLSEGAVLMPAPAATIAGVRSRVIGYSISHAMIVRLLDASVIGRAPLRRELAQIAGGLDGDIYINSSGLVWRTTGHITKVEDGEEFTIDLATTYLDYGAPVHVLAPAARNVTVVPLGTDPFADTQSAAPSGAPS